MDKIKAVASFLVMTAGIAFIYVCIFIGNISSEPKISLVVGCSVGLLVAIIGAMWFATILCNMPKDDSDYEYAMQKKMVNGIIDYAEAYHKNHGMPISKLTLADTIEYCVKRQSISEVEKKDKNLSK